MSLWKELGMPTAKKYLIVNVEVDESQSPPIVTEYLECGHKISYPHTENWRKPGWRTKRICVTCNENLKRPRPVGRPRVEIDAQELERQYSKKKAPTLKTLAKQFGCSVPTIWRELRKLGIVKHPDERKGNPQPTRRLRLTEKTRLSKTKAKKVVDVVVLSCDTEIAGDEPNDIEKIENKGD